jgi:hypothetical protein
MGALLAIPTEIKGDAMTHSSDTTYYAVKVLGRTYEGFKARMDYTFDHVPTLQEVKSQAGDFAELLTVKVVRVHRISYESHKAVKLAA